MLSKGFSRRWKLSLTNQRLVDGYRVFIKKSGSI